MTEDVKHTAEIMLAAVERAADRDDGWAELTWNTPKGWCGIRITTEPPSIRLRFYYNGWREYSRKDAATAIEEVLR